MTENRNTARIDTASDTAQHPAAGQAPATEQLPRSADVCPGFPDRCPNIRQVPADPPTHYGGIRCGCIDAQPVVGYRDPNNPRVLLCRQHGQSGHAIIPVTAEDLPDGGVCTFGRLSSNECGRDVLAGPEPATERQFLTFALDQAADEMALGDGFTDEDEAALARLRRMADEETR